MKKVKSNLQVNLIVGSKKGDACVKIHLPLTNEKEVMKMLKKIGAKKKADYEVLHSDCQDICIDTNTDIVKLNSQLLKIVEIGKTLDEVIAVINCGPHKNLDEAINFIATTDYEFYAFEHLDEFKDIYEDELLSNMHSSVIMDHLAERFDSFDFVEKFTNEEILSVFDADELAEKLDNAYTTKKGIIVFKN